MKRLYTPLLAVLLLSLSSCLELTEQVRMKDNGSGTFTFTLDMSAAKPWFDMLASFSDEEETSSEVQNDLNESMEEAYDRLKDMKGIHHVTTIEANSGLLSGITFEFDNVRALNMAMNEVISHEDKDGEKEFTEYFRYRNGELTRINTIDLEKRIQEETDGEIPDVDLSINGQSLQDMLKSMRYRTEYTFDGAVKKVSNPNAVLLDNGRTVRLDYYFLSSEKENNTLANRISY